jgi:glucose-6-phosphate isomerase
MKLKKLFEPVACQVDIASGEMTEPTGRYTKYFRDLSGLYGDEAAFSAMTQEWSDRAVYDVCEFRPNEAAGDMIFGVTRMSPGKVGDEFFVTRGHIHRNAERPEIYYGQKGHGVMLLESPEGEVRAFAIDPFTCCYVPPYWIHRSVNVGDEDLVMLFCYPADSGQDYSIIEKAGGMRTRIVDDGKGGWKEIENAGWRPRDAAALDAVYGKEVKA